MLAVRSAHAKESWNYSIFNEYLEDKAKAKKLILEGIKNGTINEGDSVIFAKNYKSEYLTVAYMKSNNTAKAKPGLIHHDLRKYQNDDTLRFNMQVRHVNWHDDKLSVAIYMWQQKDDSNLLTFPFRANEEIYFEFSNGTPFHGKITMVDNDYYGGTCIVLYATASKASYKAWCKNPLERISHISSK